MEVNNVGKVRVTLGCISDYFGIHPLVSQYLVRSVLACAVVTVSGNLAINF